MKFSAKKLDIIIEKDILALAKKVVLIIEEDITIIEENSKSKNSSSGSFSPSANLK
ncbi:hypothetical protein Fsol_00629 [Candidatus Fokinia solitaria]|uniref:Uncharacterized protein n=1 Tax=Candidatus Fokinia solitaria TaxID=1802984 RepID=A0A2U8BSY2_9RICK|nr:hypothetical protein Fsol_00629 [Candidatus Fokinia solitaria]